MLALLHCIRLNGCNYRRPPFAWLHSHTGVPPATHAMHAVRAEAKAGLLHSAQAEPPRVVVVRQDMQDALAASASDRPLVTCCFHKVTYDTGHVSVHAALLTTPARIQ